MEQAPQADRAAVSLSDRQQVQEDEYVFPYHYIDLYLRSFAEVRCLDGLSALAAVKRLAGPFNGGRLLDAGCGDGRFCYELRDEPVTVVGVDYSERALRFARAFNPRAEFRCGDLTTLDFSEPFDCITLIEVLEHIPPQGVEGMLAALDRCLAPGGKLVVSVPSTLQPLSDKHYRHFTPKLLAETMSPRFEPATLLGHGRGGRPWRRFTARRRFAERYRHLLKRVGLERWYVRRLGRLYRERIETCPPGEATRLIGCFRKRPAD